METRVRMTDNRDLGRSGYLDLLITTLTEHEKNMDRLIERIEKLTQDLQNVLKEFQKEMGKRISASPKTETITYMKINLNRPTEEIIKIIKTLKE